MESSVAGQSPFLGGGASATSFFRENPFVKVVDGRLHVDKNAIFRKVQAAPAAISEDEGFLQKLFERIKAFLAKLLRIVFRSRAVAASGADGQVSAAQGRPAAADGGLSEGADEIVADGLPDSVLDRAHQTIDELVRHAVGENLAPSLRAAMAMPEIDRKPALRALIEHNLGDTRQCRDLRDDLKVHVEQQLLPYATAHGIDAGTAFRILQADVQNGSNLFATRLDPEGQLRGYIGEITRLESSLSSLAQARALIASHALQAGAFTRDDLTALLEENGHDASFLAVRPVQAPVDAPSGVPSQRSGNVVSLNEFRAEAAPRGAEHNAETVEAAERAPTERAHATVLKLVEQGVVNSSNGDAATLETSLRLQEALSDEDEEFESGFSGDDLTGFTRQDKRNDTTPKA